MNDKITPTSRSYIGKQQPPPTEPAADLLKSLPKEPEDLSQPELLERFKELALRCFNSENTLDASKGLNASYEIIIGDYKKEIVRLNEIIKCDEVIEKELESQVTNLNKTVKYLKETDDDDNLSDDTGCRKNSFKDNIIR